MDGCDSDNTLLFLKSMAAPRGFPGVGKKGDRMYDFLMDFFYILELLVTAVVIALFVHMFRKRKNKNK